MYSNFTWNKQTEIFRRWIYNNNFSRKWKILTTFWKIGKNCSNYFYFRKFSKGIEDDYYSKIIQICNKYTKPVVLDCSGKALLEVLKHEYKPKVIKPNIEELSQLIGKNVSKNQNELKEILEDKLFENIEWIIVSLGADGAFAKHNDKFYKVNIPRK